MVESHNYNEKFNYPEIPVMWEVVFQVLGFVDGMPLVPADDLNRIENNGYNIVGTLEAANNPGRYNALERYLSLSVQLADLLRSDPDDFAKEDTFDNFVYGLNIAEALGVDDPALKAYIEQLRGLPKDTPPLLGMINTALEQAFEIYVASLGIDAAKYPFLEYPVGFKTLPHLTTFGINTKNLMMTFFIHQALVHPNLFRRLVQGESKTTNLVLPDPSTPPTLPVKYLQEALSTWVKHLRDGWQTQETDLFLEVGRNSAGFRETVNVKGWAKLSLDYNLVHNANVRLTMLVRNLARILQEISSNGMILPSEEEEEDDEDKKKQMLRKGFDIKYEIAEYEVISDIIYNFVQSNREQLHSVEKFDELGDLAYDSEAVERLIESGCVEISQAGGIVDFTILVDFDNQKYQEIFSSHLDPLLATADEDADIITPDKEHYIYVPPLIWEVVKMHLGSKFEVPQLD